MSATVIGVFDRLDDARTACSRLGERGIDTRSMRLDGGPPGSIERRADADPQNRLHRLVAELGLGEAAAHGGRPTEAVRRGAALLSVSGVDGQRLAEVCAVLQDCGAIDIDQRIDGNTEPRS